LHSEELHILYSSFNVIRQIKSSRVRWVEHVARMEEGRNVYLQDFGGESLKEGDHSEDRGVSEKMRS
jgi:hypothetical protein